MTTLADIFLAEIDKHQDAIAPAHRHLLVIGRELATKYKANLETLAAISGDYVKASRASAKSDVSPSVLPFP